LRQFDYNTISDVIIHLNYTAREDAGLFKEKAVEHLKEVMIAAEENNGRPFQRLFSLRHEFTNEWYRFLHPDPDAGINPMEIPLTKDRFPFFARKKENKDIIIDSVDIYGDFKDDELGIKMSISEIQLETGVAVGGLQHWSKKGLSKPISSDPQPWSLTVTKTTTEIPVTRDDVNDLFLLVKYHLG
jgi:hypothetical protein